MNQMRNLTACDYDLVAGTSTELEAFGVQQGLAPVLPDPQPGLIDIARSILRARAAYAKILPKGLSRDSAWDMMLELYVASAGSGHMYIKQLIAASGEPSTCAMRRIDRLEAAHLIRRTPDTADHRRVTVTLTAHGQAAIALMLGHLHKPEHPKLAAPAAFVPHQ